jgi:hypothetical protein
MFVTRVLRALFLGLAVACASGQERPGPEELVGPSGDGRSPEDDAGGIEPPPAGCDADFCGDTFLQEVTNPPNLYFLVDRSGSMAAFPGNSSLTKYDMARRVLGDLLKVIGHRVRYGASIFPARTDLCGPGHEVFAPALGGLPPCTGELDPVLADFLDAFRFYAPNGATPTSAALADLRPELESLDGDTYLVVITDGAPNCNDDATCEPAECTLNIEGASVGKHSCSNGFNCCDPELVGEGAQGNCVDGDESERQIALLAKHGIPTYVIGMPGAEPYASVLDRMARAGGTARSGATAYYAVSDRDELEDALYSIGTGVAIRCSIDLDEEPQDTHQVNVYFDDELVPQDADNGWSWAGPTQIEVTGEACDALKSGSVLAARAVYGCDTVVR